MKIYSISVVKNEEDVISLSLIKAMEWSDKIFVLDNGSTDETWSIVKSLSEKYPKIIAWKQLNVPFYEGLRGEVFNEFKSIAEDGDWWCFRLDADEFYVDSPKEILQKVSNKHHYICKDSIEYHLTFNDLETLDFTLMFENLVDKIRYYQKLTYREARFFRHRKNLKWDTKDPFPKHMGIVSPLLIRAKHYQYRSPSQIQQRLNVRNEARINGFDGWDHASQMDYIEKIKNSEDLLYDNQDGIFQTTGSANNHKHSIIKLIIKHVLHGLKILP
jgi:glycosyltransferase involved in cell wall biosynthesis